MRTPRAMSLVDVIVGTALVLIVFVVLLGLLRASLLISSSAKAKAGATAVATTQMEYLRSLAYSEVGTAGGIPSGSVPQQATTTLNGISYHVRTLVQYVDDPADGLGTGDRNGIPTDYKRVRVAASYAFRGESREVALVSTIAPPAMETAVDGGTLRIQVVNASGAPVPGASVRIQNASVVPSVDFTTFTDMSGAAIVPGAPAATGYVVSVTKDGYSSAMTYAHTAENQNPAPGHLTVTRAQTTTSTFAIDVLGTLTLRTFFPVAATSTTDALDTMAGVASSANLVHAAGALSLAPLGEGSYASEGNFMTEPIAFPYLASWTRAALATSVPEGTGVRLRIYDEAGTLLPESAVPGNTSGAAASSVSLEQVSTTTYPRIRIGATLLSAGTASPQVTAWTVNGTAGPLPAPNVSLTLTGEKRKGTTGAGTPLPKTLVATTTDAAGVRHLPLEWDVYALQVSGRTLIDASSSAPFTLAPGTTLESALIVR